MINISMKENLDRLLIDKGKIPDINKEYIYMMDMVWKVERSLDSYSIPKYTLIKNVRLGENNRGYVFNLLDSEDLTDYRTNYAWSICENTEENKKQLANLIKIDKSLKKLEKDRRDIINNITLKIKD